MAYSPKVSKTWFQHLNPSQSPQAPTREPRNFYGKNQANWFHLSSEVEHERLVNTNPFYLPSLPRSPKDYSPSSRRTIHQSRTTVLSSLLGKRHMARETSHERRFNEYRKKYLYSKTHPPIKFPRIIP